VFFNSTVKPELTVASFVELPKLTGSCFLKPRLLTTRGQGNGGLQIKVQQLENTPIIWFENICLVVWSAAAE
jgi:hypothetical protein